MRQYSIMNLHVLCTILLFAFFGHLGAHEPFPVLTTYSLSGEQKTLPHPSLIFISCDQKKKEDLKKWYRALQSKSWPKHISIAIVPVFPTLLSWGYARTCLLNQVQAALPPSYKPYVFAHFSDRATLATALYITESDLNTLHLFLVDKAGNITWKAKGAPTDKAIEAIRNLILHY